MEVQGTITKILEKQTGESKAGKEWKKQSFVIDTGDQYNPEVCFQVFGDDKISMLSKFSIGQEVKVAFNVSSREYNGKYYHNLDAWKIKEVGSSEQTPQAPSSEEDYLPF